MNEKDIDFRANYALWIMTYICLKSEGKHMDKE